MCVLSVMFYATLQRLDWPLHKTECKVVRGGKATPLVRLALRALTRDTQHLCSRKSLVNSCSMKIIIIMSPPVPDDFFWNRDGQLLIAGTAHLCKHPPHVILQLFRRVHHCGCLSCHFIPFLSLSV